MTGRHPHVSAKGRHHRATQAKLGVSFATLYKALNQLREPGLLRIITADPSHAYFGTDTSDHHHPLPRGREADHQRPFRRHQRGRPARSVRRHPDHPYRRGRSGGRRRGAKISFTTGCQRGGSRGLILCLGMLI
ncbi:transcriptional repressor [Mesorhizobium sp. M1295]|uniref:transcriptional repressor n=1 Tax=Mesorhizobium sp. M1295 TaxID=2957076 RepID=UPI0033375556